MTPLPTNFPETFLYYIWRTKSFHLQDLKTEDGQSLQILDWGFRNDHAGPDFLHAKIKLADTLWAGHIEMHVHSTDWKKHKHTHDPAYQNVILHVVHIHDEDITFSNGAIIPTLVLGSRIPESMIEKYGMLMSNETWIPCQNQINQVPEIILKAWLERVLVERLMDKTDYIQSHLNQTKTDWEETYFRVLARNFGFKANGEAFETLAISLPLKILLKHKDQITQIEALLFGQAGLLEQDFKDDYPNKLKDEYQFLRKKYKLSPISVGWQFMRMRPANFPTIRIAQFAVLIFKTVHLFSKTLASTSLKELENMFQSNVSWYWKEHYTFDEKSSKSSKKLGKQAIKLIITNSVAPMLFYYGTFHAEDRFRTKALQYLSELKPESNSIVKKFLSFGLEVNNAFETQALIQLKNKYCKEKRCLECSIGHTLIGK